MAWLCFFETRRVMMRFHLVRPNIHRSRPDREGGIICQGPQPVTIPAFGHDRCTPLEITILSAADLRAPCVGLSGAMRTSTQPAGPHRVGNGPRSGLDDELPDLVAGDTHADFPKKIDGNHRESTNIRRKSMKIEENQMQFIENR